MLLHALHQEYANRYIQYYGERYITSGMYIERLQNVKKALAQLNITYPGILHPSYFL